MIIKMKYQEYKLLQMILIHQVYPIGILLILNYNNKFDHLVLYVQSTKFFSRVMLDFHNLLHPENQINISHISSNHLTFIPPFTKKKTIYYKHRISLFNTYFPPVLLVVIKEVSSSLVVASLYSVDIVHLANLVVHDALFCCLIN